MSSPEYRGDFRLLNPYPVLRDEDGGWHCPMPAMRRSYNDDGDDIETTRVLCGEELRVEWRLLCPVPDPGDAMPMADASDWAFAGWWELRCGNGHVIGTSADTSDAVEEPAPFDVRFFFGGDPR